MSIRDERKIPSRARWHEQPPWSTPTDYERVTTDGSARIISHPSHRRERNAVIRRKIVSSKRAKGEMRDQRHLDPNRAINAGSNPHVQKPCDQPKPDPNGWTGLKSEADPEWINRISIRSWIRMDKSDQIPNPNGLIGSESEAEFEWINRTRFRIRTGSSEPNPNPNLNSKQSAESESEFEWINRRTWIRVNHAHSRESEKTRAMNTVSEEQRWQCVPSRRAPLAWKIRLHLFLNNENAAINITVN